MIVTVTMNPAIDKTVEIDSFVYGGLNRIKCVEYDVGGKGINVSKTLNELGVITAATGFVGGSSGKTIEAKLKQRGILTDFVNVAGETRTNTKIVDAGRTVTELNEPGPKISDENMNKLINKLESYADVDTIFVLSGSIPLGIDKNIYAKIINILHKKHSKVILDADGETFRASLEAVPDIIKPNAAELKEFAFLQGRVSDNEIIRVAEGFIKRGIKSAAVSMGSRGAIFVFGDYKVKCPALSVKALSTVGAGDAMVAALAYSQCKRLGSEETVKMCMALSAGAVTTIGTKPPSAELVERLKDSVVIEKIG